ncbi:DUF4376 domain-containing protein [Pseudomonas fluorescens]|uniref:DUF4376 domain-containing protein n=1 Tax=Pseudomonas fluorescens TaxID=294 RepID=A0A423M9L0_PSEFL|nr:DUF4376 domain-containing protein [Pseudomonas fluorescens]RON79510.1 hypothetical protein BK670_18580 [Pseudomonas fluorescens]
MKYAVFNDDATLMACLVKGIHEVPRDAIPLSEALFLRITQELDGVWTLVDGEVVKMPLPKIVPDFAKKVAAERFRREAVGVEVDGMQIETTRDSQALIASTGLSAVLDSEYRCNFKTMTGFVSIGSTQIIAIAKAVRAHVQACFDRELTLLRAIEAGEYRDEMLAEGWPDSSLPESASL